MTAKGRLHARRRVAARAGRGLSSGAARCRRKFLRYFPGGFHDETYLEWERGYKVAAHERWVEALGPQRFEALLSAGEFSAIAQAAVRVEGRTSLLFSFEKMALRDAVRELAGARAFAEGLFDFLYGSSNFERWCGVLSGLPRRQTRVLTWPIATIFGFLAQPKQHVYLKPNVTRRAAEAYGFDFEYWPRPNAGTYHELLELAARVKADLSDLRPRDQIDVQSFLWVQGSDEYP